MQKLAPFGMNGFMVFLLTCFSVIAHAQQTGYLILIDADNKEPFTVRVGDELYFSSTHGHLVLSPFKDSVYRLNIRFPKKNEPEQVFRLTIRNKDLGFQLKGADSSWVLYNWQTKETIRPVNETDSSRILEQGVKRDDGFSKLMAAVVNDTAVMYNTYTGTGLSRDSVVGRPIQTAFVPVPATGDKHSANRHPQVNKPPVVVSAAASGNLAAGKDSLPVAKKQAGISDSAVRKQAESTTGKLPAPAVSTAAIPSTDKQPKVLLPSDAGVGQAVHQPGTPAAGVKKLREVSLKISRKLVFTDIGKDGATDTITLFVYFETGDSLRSLQAKVAAAPTINKTVLTDTTALAKGMVKNKPAAKPISAGTCVEQASEADFETARSAILTANAEKDKITAASVAFGQKCFSVAQVRLLASLFVSDKGRYRLMEAARMHISDREHFRELADMYTDKNFQKKFLDMAEKRS